MNFQPPPPQVCFFYEGNWTEETVNIFINILMDDVKEGVWDVNKVNVDSIEAAKDFVNVMLEKDYSDDDVRSLCNLLKKRCTTFRRVLGTKGVHWDRNLNFVYADKDVWHSLFKEDKFTMAFFHKGGDLYDCLLALFGTEKNKSTVVINISSDGPIYRCPTSAANPFIIPDTDGEQEINSPVLGGRKPPHKKLFSEDVGDSTRSLRSLESYTVAKTIYEKEVREKRLLLTCKPLTMREHLKVAGSSSSNNNEKQDFIFYTLEWKKLIETRFLHGLLLEKDLGNFDPCRIDNRIAINKVMTDINCEFGTNFDYKYCSDRACKHHRRYEIFHLIMTSSGVGYNPTTGSLECEPETWKSIRQHDRLAMAYTSSGEPFYEELSHIFNVTRDIVGYYDLETIQEVSSEINSVPVDQNIRFPRIEHSHDSTFWNELDGHGSDNDSNACF